MSVEKFWTEDPCVLFSNLKFLPTSNMSRDEKLNALTRLTLIVAAGLYFAKYEFWFTFLIIAILLIVLLKYAGVKDGKQSGDSDDNKEEFTLTPTYASPDLHTTTLAPLFSEEWQIYPPAYDIYVNDPDPNITFQEPLNPQMYPYGQYLTRTNLLPSDEYGSHMLNGGPRQAREYANSAFLRHRLGFQENMSRLYKKKLARRFRSNCNDTFSPFQSY
ncbi:MAG TPA: hypothetical protein PKD85_00985 [Saprospiraceae bacterium]|nr:hypothetical protein [Saprospiraceae bacterium]